MSREARDSPYSARQDSAVRTSPEQPWTVEPHSFRRAPGRVIFLNGASRSGKSTLAKALQHALEEPFLHVSSDQIAAAGMLPDRREGSGLFNGGTRCARASSLTPTAACPLSPRSTTI